MRLVNVGPIVRRAMVAAAVLATWAATASAQGETAVRTLGGATRFSSPMHSVDDLRIMTNANRTQLTSVFATAGLSHISNQIFDALTNGRVSDATIAPGTHMDWMAFKRGGTPAVTYNVRWVGRQSFDAWQFTVDDGRYAYTFAVPKVCGNFSLVGRTASAVVAAPAPPPPPAPRPEPPPVARVAPPPPPPPPAPLAPAPPGEYFGWTATGFIGSYFGAGGEAAGANDINGSLTFGGQLGKMWGHFGAELLADFAPKYKIESLALSEHPEVNSYMANVVGIWNTRFQTKVQPYLSGGIGGIQLHASVLPASALTGSTTNTKVDKTDFGWNIGAGAFAFAGRSVGLRADVRYYKANSSASFTGTPAQTIGNALLSGIDFWRANIGVAFRW
jgi:opacity protein-like surface antigen